MLKLARNALADKKIFKSEEGNINWMYISDLNDIQNSIGFKFANKLTSRHIHYRNSIMKVNLAAQVLSSGVADAIQYLQNKNEEQFQNSEATVYFIRQIDRIFCILNSRIPFSTGFKSPINSGNINTIRAIFDQTINYLKKLKIHEIPILSSGRKMFAIGFIITMKSTLSVSYQLLNKSLSPLKFVLTYKMSQDHLELFFGCVQARGGSNNNPNSVQFKNTLRQLLFTKNITVESGNCSNLDF